MRLADHHRLVGPAPVGGVEYRAASRHPYRCRQGTQSAGEVRDAARSDAQCLPSRQQHLSSMGVKVFEQEAGATACLAGRQQDSMAVCMKKAAR